jgi:hypothetical protein
LGRVDYRNRSCRNLRTSSSTGFEKLLLGSLESQWDHTLSSIPPYIHFFPRDRLPRELGMHALGKPLVSTSISPIIPPRLYVIRPDPSPSPSISIFYPPNTYIRPIFKTSLLFLTDLHRESRPNEKLQWELNKGRGGKHMATNNMIPYACSLRLGDRGSAVIANGSIFLVNSGLSLFRFRDLSDGFVVPCMSHLSLVTLLHQSPPIW